LILSAILLLLVWLALARRLDPATIGFGVGAVLIVMAVRRLLFPTPDLALALLLRRPIRLVRFLAALALRFVLSTAYTVRLILLGREEGRVVTLPIRVTHPIGQLILLNAITLTPSTISLLLEEDLLYIHWLRAAHEEGDWRTIKDTLERHVLELFPAEDQ
jgi:multisubunit Na+/H+ antiporter MnhE subunit